MVINTIMYISELLMIILYLGLFLFSIIFPIKNDITE